MCLLLLKNCTITGYVKFSILAESAKEIMFVIWFIGQYVKRITHSFVMLSSGTSFCK